MVLYFLKDRKNTESKNRKTFRSKNGKIMLLSRCKVCDNKILKFIKEQESSGSSTSSGIKTPLSKIPAVGILLFLEY